MTFTALKSLLSVPLAEDQAKIDAQHGLGSKAHPTLSRAEIVRMTDKFDQARDKLEEIETIFKDVAGATGPAHKLHHIGSKAGMDMGAFADVQAKIGGLFDAIDDCHQAWSMSTQQDTGAFDELDALDQSETDPSVEADQEYNKT